MHNFYRVVMTSFADETEEKAAEALADYLPTLSAQGSADDMSVGCILDIEHIKDNAVLYERKKEPYLKIYRAGNLGAPSVSDDYIQKKEIEANEGAVHLDMIGCGGFQKGMMELEILSVEDSTVTISANGKQYKLTPEERIEIIDSDLSDGIGQYDTLIIQCIMK